MVANVAIVILAQGGLETALRIKAALPQAVVHGLSGRVKGADVDYAEFGTVMRDLYRRNTPIVALCAAGIVIRTLAPLLADKRAEPPVLAVAQDGSAVVPLMGGLNGVNDLARQIGAALGTAPAITTSGEIRFNATFERPPDGYRLANPESAKTFMSDLLAGAGLFIDGHAPFLDLSRFVHDPFGLRRLVVTTGVHEPRPDELVFHPQSVVVAATGDWDRIPQILAEHNLSPLAVAFVAMPESAFNVQSWPIRLVPGHPSALDMASQAVPDPLDLFDHGAVAVGVARSPAAVVPVGHKRGRLAVVGLGPGSPDFLAPAAKAELFQAEHIVGYQTYVDMAGPFRPDQTVHASDNRVEMERSRHAFALAAQGCHVTVVSSGDPGVFAMATAVIEALHQSGDPVWHGVDLVVVPGISAAQSAAAKAGAPLGHDFCVLSLSDNLKPWPVIEKRLELAAQADLVLAFYNPVSKARPWQLGRALEIVRAHRPGSVSVVLGRDVGRPGETVTTLTLDALTPDQVDMRTVVIVGSSATTTFPRADGGTWTYTPRWYKDR